MEKAFLLFLLGRIFFLESLYLGMEYVLWVVQNPKKIHVCCTRICPPHSYIPSTFFSHTTIFYKKGRKYGLFEGHSWLYVHLISNSLHFLWIMRRWFDGNFLLPIFFSFLAIPHLHSCCKRKLYCMSVILFAGNCSKKVRGSKLGLQQNKCLSEVLLPLILNQIG